MDVYVKDLSALVDGRADEFLDISDKIWGFAESKFQEFRSFELQASYMEKLGFKVTRGIGGEDTAFVAEFGQGKPVIGLLGEYDGLENLSQEADLPEKKPVEAGAVGHGCGHNMLGTACLAAAVAVKEYLESNELQGTVRYYGCPAEENAGGKAYLVREGCFDDVDACITWHPGWLTYVTRHDMLANFRIFYTFHGLSSHAAGAPHLGRSALDAVELMDVGVNYMREHMIDEARIHYAITDTGGTAPNVVQSQAQVLYAIRAPKVTQVKDLADRVNDCARGAALMTGTTVDIRQVAAYSDLIHNETLNLLVEKHMKEIYPLDYTEEDYEYAKKFTAVISDMDRKGLVRLTEYVAGRGKAEQFIEENPIINMVVSGKPPMGAGSTDVGDVSWVVPTCQFNCNTWAPGTPAHAWQVVAQGKGPVGHKATIAAAKIMAASVWDLFLHPEVVDEAKAEHREMLGGEKYPDPLPADAKPGIWD
ncbi:MAG: amidohydrolase [Firmicutes bacterium]|nr:amidohydrolase [Bacillota bacterium]